MRDFDYFADQAATLRRLCNQFHDCDDTPAEDERRRLDKYEQALQKADDEEDGERFDGCY